MNVNFRRRSTYLVEVARFPLYHGGGGRGAVQHI